MGKLHRKLGKKSKWLRQAIVRIGKFERGTEKTEDKYLVWFGATWFHLQEYFSRIERVSACDERSEQRVNQLLLLQRLKREHTRLQPTSTRTCTTSTCNTRCTSGTTRCRCCMCCRCCRCSSSSTRCHVSRWSQPGSPERVQLRESRGGRLVVGARRVEQLERHIVQTEHTQLWRRLRVHR